MFLGFFVDDVFGIFSSSRPSDAIAKLNDDFRRVYTWGVQRQMVFDASKFNMLNCYIKKRLALHHKSTVMFGPTHPTWTRSAPLLGVMFDNRLSFKPEMARIAKKISSTAAFRVYNHIDNITGLGVSRLLEKITIWIEPVYSYGSAVWIFKVFPDIRPDSKVAWRYGDDWEALDIQCRKMTRACECAPQIGY